MLRDVSIVPSPLLFPTCTGCQDTRGISPYQCLPEWGDRISEGASDPREPDESGPSPDSGQPDGKVSFFYQQGDSALVVDV